MIFSRVLLVALALSLAANVILIPYYPKHKELKKLVKLRDAELEDQQSFYLRELSWSEEHCKNIVEVEKIVTKTVTQIREVPALEKNSCDRLSPELRGLLENSYKSLYPATTGDSVQSGTSR